ncbi:MAG: alpha/beta hydrolase domain-containing protein [Bauldia sp.]
MIKRIRTIAVLSFSVVMAAAAAEARVVRLLVDAKASPAFNARSFGEAGQYEAISGRLIGELDPADPRNAIIQDIALAPRNARGRVEYTASFRLVKPVDMAKASGLLWHDVPNRGNRPGIPIAELNQGDIELTSGWQGDNAGSTVPGRTNDYLIVPAARNPDGSSITAPVMARIINGTGPASRPMIAFVNPLPYKPATLDTAKAVLTTHASETVEGVIGRTETIPSGDWAFARCTPERPFPGTPDPTEICLKNGFDPALLYQVVFTAADPPVLGIGFAAYRDVAEFFKNAKADDAGTPNPVAGAVSSSIIRGVSQSGNFIRQFIHLGFNEAENGRQVYDGAWPIVAGRRVALNHRFALPDSVMALCEPGAEGPQWWLPEPDPARGLPAAGMLDRCLKSRTCPKIVEHYGPTEIWWLKLSPEWVGTAADRDLALPDNVRRYYIPGTPHGGGVGGFSTEVEDRPSCPGFNQGTGILAGNPMPYQETVDAIRAHFRAWVMKGVPPPPSRYPTLRDGTLVDPTKEAMGFPTLPQLPPWAPTGLVNPVLDYDYGPDFNYLDGAGFRSTLPPAVKRVLPTKVPRVDADGNEQGGVPAVLHLAPLGTYLGWNIAADGFNKGRICSYAAGFIPFARTKAERDKTGDPRLSLEERYHDHAGYVAAVTAATEKAAAAGFLLPEDARALIEEARQGDVLR